ncbi:hypothetical protein [Tabrizicola sp.]|uniref:hypothetical protein n=1 Tax=Tabrizicola sp. TaxID=2005166 RepID=UPI002734422E|nr:hypothetical protein [Tabrizicola sp.]MDP3193905.1 hypothetical protein [Tabrizicola sp.]
MRRVLHIGLVLALLAAAPVWADVVLPPAIAGSPSLKALRKSMLAGRDLSDVQLRTLADAGEGLAAARFAKRLEERGDPAFIDDAAHYYSIAVYQGRDFAMPRLLATLTDQSAAFGPARLRNIRGVLDRAARRGDAKAASGLAQMLLKGAPFQTDIPRARELLLLAARAGDAKAAIQLALSHIKGEPGLPPDPEAARPALELALASPDPGVQAMALSLARQIPGGEDLQAAALPATDPDLDRSKRPPERPTSEGAAP